MAYATLADLIEAVGEPLLIKLTDIDTTRTGAVVVGRIEEKLDRASAEIDSYLAPRYSTPLIDVPVTIRGCCCDIAIFYLHRVAGEAVTAAYERAVRFLRDVASGKAGLPLPAGGAPDASAQADLVVVVAPAPARVGGWGVR